MSSSKVFWDALRKHKAQAADAHDDRASANPFYSAYAWWWYDEKNSTHGPYESKRAALRELLEWINHDPRESLFQRFHLLDRPTGRRREIRMSTPEGRVKAQINRALKTLPRCYKFMPVQSGLGAKTLDYLLCINGRFVAIEAKAPGKTYTPLQEAHKHEIEAAGGTVFLVDGPISLEIAMEALRGHASNRL